MKLKKSVYSTIRNYFYLIGISGLFLGFIVRAKADESTEKPVDPVVEKAVNELTQAYSKLDGYIVNYIGKSGDKSVTCIIALDFKSQLQSCDIAGKDMQMRHWTTEKDELYVTADNEPIVFRGLKKQLSGLSQICKLLGHDTLIENGQIHSMFILNKESLGNGLIISSNNKPSWTEYMTHASIQSSDAESITFNTPDYGIITIQRKSGIIIRQSLPNDTNPIRFIEMKSLKLNPSKEAVKEIIAKWPTADAKEEPIIAKMAPLWNELFQYIIYFSDEQKIKSDQLNMVLNQQYEVIRNFSKACIEQRPSAMSAKVDWTNLLKKVKASSRDIWREENPRFEDDAEKAFLEFFHTPEIRLKIRNSIIKLFIENDKIPTTVMDEIFGEGYWNSLTPKSDAGKEAKKLISTAIARAYLEAIIDQKMIAHWDQDEDID